MQVFIARFEAAAEGGYTVTFPQAPSIVTEGDDFNEAVANAQEALSAALGGEHAAPVLELDPQVLARGIAMEGATPVAVPYRQLETA